jgi:2-polyprenyl-3-methyl-5-hydroxy-6-metoxy-1,4-benzoquinol methylase
MRKLTEKSFWEQRHEAHAREAADNARRGRRLVRVLDRARASIGGERHESYAGFLLRRVLRRYLPVRPDWSAIEVGCAPGHNILWHSRVFGYRPYGVEYSSTGVGLTRDNFRREGHDPQNVIEADFFSREFQDANSGRFDVVVSSGFIEHFESPRDVVTAHLALLRPGGFLVCSVPNLRGFSYPFLRVFGRDLLHAHNLRIMRLTPYLALFDHSELRARFCGHVGMFQLFGVRLRHERSFRGMLAGALDRFMDVVGHLFFICLRGGAIETRWSPYLLYIGQKTEDTGAHDLQMRTSSKMS